MESGVDLVMEAVGLAEKLRGADLVLTGEGSIDRQSVMGKTISGVARLAREAGSVPVIACAGRIEQGQALTDELLRCGIIAAVPIVPGPCSTDEAV
ncbi:glycerate kinase, partial [Aerococcus urinae]|nr:glycerate kinase [Aerococcus urinae]